MYSSYFPCPEEANSLHVPKINYGKFAMHMYLTSIKNQVLGAVKLNNYFSCFEGAAHVTALSQVLTHPEQISRIAKLDLRCKVH